MEKSGLLRKGGGSGIAFIDPIKLQPGQKKSPNVFILAKTTTVSIDNIPANTPAGTIVVNPKESTSWGISGSVIAKGVIDVSGGVLPSANVIADDIYLIGVGGTVSTIELVSGDKIQAKINNPSDSQTGGIFDDWILVKAPTFSSTTVDRPDGGSVEASLVYLQNEKVDIVAGKQLSTEDYTTLEKTKLAGIATNAEVNVQSDYNQTDNNQDDFIKNKPILGTVASKNLGNQVGEVQENGAILGSSETVETDGTGKFITASKNTAYNKNFGTTNGDVARGDASYLKANTDSLLNAKENTANKGQPNGYASLDGSAKVPASQLPSYVDDVEEYSNLASFPTTGEIGKIYIALDTNLTYRWSGSTYVSLNDVDLSDYFNKTTDTTDDITQGTAKFTTQADIDKLAGIEANATADQTDAEIKTAYENNANTNAFTDAEQTKLAGIEQNATADQTDAEIKTAYENNANTNAFTDTEKANLSNQSNTNTGDETTSSIQSKRPLKTIEGQSIEGAGNIDLTKSDVGLANVDNTSDADKPVSTAQQTSLDGKLAKASNLSDVLNQQTALNNLTNASAGAIGDVLGIGATGDAVFIPSSASVQQAYASAFTTALITSATTLAPLSGTGITNNLSQFTVGTTSFTCNKTGTYQIMLSAVVEPNATASVSVSVLINNNNAVQTRYDSTTTGAGYFVTTSLNAILSLSNNDVIRVSKSNATDNWKGITITIVEII